MEVDYAEIAMIIAAILVGAAHSYAKYKETGKIDLDKTMELAEDVLPEVVKKAKESGRDAAVEHGVSVIKKLRGKSKLAVPAYRKVKQRLRRLLDEKNG